jgi:hypothetical protein
MLKAGELIDFEGRRGVVRHVDRRTGVASVETVQGYVEIRSNSDRNPDLCAIVADLPADWPILHLTSKIKHGAFVTLLREGEPLRPLYDFVPTTIGGRTSAVFVNPDLRLSVGEVLAGQFARGLVRVDVRRPLVTVGEITKRAEEARQRPAPITDPYEQIDRILEDEGDAEEDDD